MKANAMSGMVLLGLLAVCGCGGQSGGSSTSAGTQTGQLTVTVEWPDRQRLVPAAAESVKVDVASGGTVLQSATINRPSTSTTFANVPVGTVSVNAAAYPQADAGGVALAQGSTAATIQDSQTASVSLDMASTVDHFELTPAAPTVTVGGTATVVASARNAAGDVVLLTAGKVTWASSNASVASVSPAQGSLTVTATGASAGSAQLVVTDTESGKTSSVTVTVGSGSTGTTSPPEIDSTPFAVSAAESADTYDAADVVTNTAFGATITVDFSANTAQVSPDAAQTITSDGVTLLSADGKNVVIKKSANGVTVTSTVGENVKYDLTGQLSGTLTVSSSSAYQLYLNGLTINGTAGPALDLESTQKVFIVSAFGTTNTLADSATRTMTMKAALYGKGPMVFSGDGAISVTGSYKHGIFSNDTIRVRGGTLNVAVSAKDALRSVNGFIFDDGRLTVTATGTTVDDESKGIKVEGSETTGTGKGFIVVNGGRITITSVGKAITAGWDIDEDATTTTTSDDPSPGMVINGGVITLTTTGTPYEYVSGGATVSCSPEGLEAKTDLTINNGYLIINTTDDALNAGKSLTINGGYTYCASSRNDAIDSNGRLSIAGGVVVAIGSGAPEGPFDCDQNTFLISGGTFVGIGGTTSRPTATQNTVVLGNLPSGSTMSIRAADGTSAFSYTVPQTAATMVLSSPNIKTGAAYTVYTGGTVTATNVFKGLYLGALGHSGGTTGSSFTASSGITKIGGVYF